MGAEIWIGKEGSGLGYYKEAYTGAIALNAIGLSYWSDLYPRLSEKSRELPLELNPWLLGELESGIESRLNGPQASQYAKAYLAEAQIEAEDPGPYIEAWRAKLEKLIKLIERSSQLGIPLTMSL